MYLFTRLWFNVCTPAVGKTSITVHQSWRGPNKLIKCILQFKLNYDFCYTYESYLYIFRIIKLNWHNFLAKSYYCVIFISVLLSFWFVINNILFLTYEIWFYLVLIRSIKILLLLYSIIHFLGFPYTTKQNKICGGPRDSGKIRSSSWSAKFCPGLLYVKLCFLNSYDNRLVSGMQRLTSAVKALQKEEFWKDRVMAIISLTRSRHARSCIA
jgi:hypothetical protein